jgi:CubicO group peptidase (beta-lactamase class C family)
VTTVLPTGVHGTVHPGYEPVRQAFEAGAADLGEGGGAFAVCRDGRVVVDLWAGTARPGEPWAHDTMATLMSTTKGLTALVAQVLCSEGQLDVEKPVAHYWPEFAQNGKQDATVRMVLDHTVGVLGLPHAADLLDWDGNGWDDYDAIAAQLAAAEPAWQPGTAIGYHAISYGWMVGEIVRRITGQTVGAVLQDTVARPLGLDLHIGTPAAEEPRVARIVPESRDGLPEDLLAADAQIRASFNEPGSLLALAAISIDGTCITDNLGGFMNLPRVRELEIAAANGSGGARDLARVYGALAGGGELDGVRIVSEESVRLFSTRSADGRSAISPPLRLPSGLELPPPYTCYALGYALNEPEPGQPPGFGPNTATFGHAGHGGQVGYCDPVAGLGVGFVRSHLAISPHFVASLLAALYDCLPD